ncbi:MAG TPA: dipeptide ABC transporter ATP-binding protein [Methanofastidiosum sp.]|nr:dipeptide ABC transporter ATP-binding protein [Methanofastidiosum sp.]
MEILEVIELKKYFNTKAEFLQKSCVVKAVDNVSFKIMEGEILGLVGESGCGKTTCGKTVLKIYEPDSGKILFRGEDITQLGRKEMRSYRTKMGIVYQDPFGSLDPRMTVGSIISEPMEIHNLYPKSERHEKIKEIMEKVGLTSEQMNRYPHEFSGGQRQRIGIARTLALNPEFVVADEPVSALDVSIQAQILNLMQDLQKEFGFTYLFITHDLSVIKHICDRVGVMYVGKIVEMAPKKALFKNPKHPYTEALLSAVPSVNPKVRQKHIILEGDVPSPINPPSGCRFHERCFKKIGKICETKEPELIEVGKNHFVACHLY